MTLFQRHAWLRVALLAAGSLIALNFVSLSLLGGCVIMAVSPVLNGLLGAARVATIEHRLQLNTLILFFLAGTFWPLCVIPASGIAYGRFAHRTFWFKLTVLVVTLYVSAVIITVVLYVVVAPNLGHGV